MKLVRRFLSILVAAVMCISLTVLFGVATGDVAMAQTNPAGDADASTIRVKLSTGDNIAVPFSIDGIYSILERPDLFQLAPGDYFVQNDGGTLSLIDNNGGEVEAVATGLGTITIQEHANPGGTNLITLAAEGVDRDYMGSMKFWPDGPYVDAVNHIYLEKYLYGVVGYEMSDYWPMEALKAQAIAARCYAAKKMEGGRSANYDIGDTSSDQVYKGYNSSYTNVINAVDSTAGQVLTYDNSIITANFAASNGGQTDRTENVWSSALPYFKIQDDQFDLDNPDNVHRDTHNTAFFTVGTTTDKNEDMPSLPLQPMAFGEAYGASRVYMYLRPDTGSGKMVTFKRGEKFFVYEMNSAWVKAKTGDKVGFIQTKYTRIYNLETTVPSAKRKLMEGPSSRSKVLLVLPKKAVVTIISYGKWCKVNYNGTEGYISKSYLRYVKHSAPPPAVIEQGCTFTVTSTTYLRAKAKSSGKRLSKLRTGARVTLVSTGKTWYQVSYDGKTGYVLAKYLQLVIPSLVLTSYTTTGSSVGAEDIRYTQDDTDTRLIDFLRYSAANMLSGVNASQPDGSKYYTAQDTIKIKAIPDMSGIQTGYRPYCRHDPGATDGAPHDASNCPSKDFTGVKMTILLKVQKEDASKQGGFDRVDYTWNFQFAIPEYLKSDTYPQWHVFENHSLRIYAVERGQNESGIDSFKLINRRYGHGIGMSQLGAQQRANDGQLYTDILSFYYPNTISANMGLNEVPLPPLPTPTPAPTPTPTPEPTLTPSETPTLSPTVSPT